MTITQQFNFQFCNEADRFGEHIIPTIAHTIFNGAAEGKVQNRYEEMKQNFEKPFDEWELDKNVDYNKYKDPFLPLNEINDPTIRNDSNVGIDLPVWFNYSSKNRKVMLVAMEPLRKADASVAGYATLGSPFALASLKLQNTISWRLISSFIRQLIETDHSVYVTDIGKIYSQRNGKKYTGDPQLNENAFKEELRHFSPDYILCFGKEVHTTVVQTISVVRPDLCNRVLRLVHPAGRQKGKRYFEVFIKNINLFSNEA